MFENNLLLYCYNLYKKMMKNIIKI